MNMSAQGDCDFLVKRARELVPKDPWAAKAWLITARTLYPADFNIQVQTDHKTDRQTDKRLINSVRITSFTVLLQKDHTQHALLRICKTSGNTHRAWDALGSGSSATLWP